MPVRQYIGARYVPTYYQNSLDPTSSEWEANVKYDPLTIVTLPNLHSYQSKKFVPANVGSPASNPEYWYDQGYANAYYQALQDQIDDMNDGNVPGSLQNQINDNDTDISNLSTELARKQTKVYKKAIIVGDSWAVGYYSGVDHPGQGWGDYACPLLGIDSSNILTVASGGSGFCNGTGEHFDAQILRAYTDYPAFRDADLILCVGGFNDAQDSQSYSAVKTAAGSFFDNCKNYFTNAETHMFPLQLPYDSNMTAIREGVLEAIKTAFFNETTGNLFLHEGAHTWANEYGAGASAGDGSHLNQYGYSYMGQKIAELVRNGGNYYPHLHGTFDLSGWSTYIDDTQFNKVYQVETGVYMKLAVHVVNLPTTAKIQPPYFAKFMENHFIPLDTTYFLTANTSGININSPYTGWVMLDKFLPIGIY